MLQNCLLASIPMLVVFPIALFKKYSVCCEKMTTWNALQQHKDAKGNYCAAYYKHQLICTNGAEAVHIFANKIEKIVKST